ncbi:MAG: hypothetical protein ACRD5F_01475 [Candidatus Acidiferrales bacterium]
MPALRSRRFRRTLIEHKPGVVATAYGLLTDFLRAAREPRS